MSREGKWCVEDSVEVNALKRFLFRSWQSSIVPVFFVFCVQEDLNDFIVYDRADEDFEVCMSYASGRQKPLLHYCEHSPDGSRIFNDCLPWAEAGAASGSLITQEGVMVSFKGRQPKLKRLSKHALVAGLERGRYLYDQLVSDTSAKVKSGLCPCETTPIRAF